GNLLIMPRRVVFEGSRKSQELTLANTGADTAKYVVSIVQMRMKEDGSFEQITTPDSGQFFADKYFRFFPRTVNLPPNQSQVVKMQLTKSTKMASGEYRSHIYFRAVRKDNPLGEDPSQKDSLAVSVRLSPVFGITIPAIIRVGECSAKVSLSDLAFEIISDTIPRLQLNFIRSGNISVYGDIIVNYTSPEGKISRVAIVKGVAVYSPNVLRKFQCNLDKTLGVDYHSGKLTVLYTAPEDVKASKLAEAELLLR
ncbi:MAG: molecular chaperone, partial [Bacteroidetes bacterium]|nr:molecular chaperone [Bacteroidota bacterium]